MNTYSKQLDIRAHRDPLSFGDMVEIAIYQRTVLDNVTTVAVAKLAEFSVIDRDAMGWAARPEPSLRLRLDEAQQLIDELWRAGLRPTEGSGSAGAMAAVERHLEDMRTLVFKKPV